MYGYIYITVYRYTTVIPWIIDYCYIFSKKKILNSMKEKRTVEKSTVLFSDQVKIVTLFPFRLSLRV